jgi:hypothetical protein
LRICNRDKGNIGKNIRSGDEVGDCIGQLAIALFAEGVVPICRNRLTCERHAYGGYGSGYNQVGSHAEDKYPTGVVSTEGTQIQKTNA